MPITGQGGIKTVDGIKVGNQFTWRKEDYPGWSWGVNIITRAPKVEEGSREEC